MHTHPTKASLIGSRRNLAPDRIELVEVAIRRLEQEINEADWRGEDVALLKARLEDLYAARERGAVWHVSF